MIKADIDDTQLSQAIEALQSVEPDVIAPEFTRAAEQTTRYLERDMRRGVARVTGDLARAIAGEVERVSGSDVDMLMSANASHRGYNYAARLDRDGSMRWVAGPFRGRPTFGWWTSVMRRNAPKVARRYFMRAVEQIVVRLARSMGGEG